MEYIFIMCVDRKVDFMSNFEPKLLGETMDFTLFLEKIPQILGFGNTIDDAINDLYLSLQDYVIIYLSDSKYVKANNTKDQKDLILELKKMSEEQFYKIMESKLQK